MVGLAVGAGYASDPAISLAMLTAAVADLRVAQQHAAQAAAARRAAGHLYGLPAYHGPTSRQKRVRERASDVAGKDVPAGLTLVRQDS